MKFQKDIVKSLRHHLALGDVSGSDVELAVSTLLRMDPSDEDLVRALCLTVIGMPGWRSTVRNCCQVRVLAEGQSSQGPLASMFARQISRIEGMVAGESLSGS